RGARGRSRRSGVPSCGLSRRCSRPAADLPRAATVCDCPAAQPAAGRRLAALDSSLSEAAGAVGARGARLPRARGARARGCGGAEGARSAEPAEPRVRGNELGLPPGPEIGRVLAAIEEERAAGTISTRKEALELARRLRAG